MRRGLFIFLIILSLVFNYSGVFAEGLLLSYDGAVHKYTGNIYTLKVNNETINSDMPPIIINGRSLVPVRAIFEKLGAKVQWDGANKIVSISYDNTSVELKINDSYALVNRNKVKMDVPAKIINNRTVVPLRFVGEQLDMKVGWNPEKGEITLDNNKVIAMGNLNDIKHSAANNLQQVTIDLDTYKGYKIMRVAEPDRIVVDFPGTRVSSAQRSIDVSNDLIKTIRCGQFDQGTARVVLDVVGQPQYQVKEGGRSVVLSLQGGSTDVSDGQPGSQPQTDQIGGNKLDIKHIVKADHEEVHIKASKDSSYSTFQLTEPTNRVVVDIPGASVEEGLKRLEVNSVLVSAVRSANQEGNSARVVVDLKLNPNHKVLKSEEYIVVYISKTSISDSPEISLPTRGDAGSGDIAPKDNILAVNYLNSESAEEVVLTVNNYKDYSIIKNMDNNTIVIDIPNTLGPYEEKTISADSSLIGNINYVGIDRSYAKVTIELKGKSQYQVIEQEGRLILSLSEALASTPEATPAVIPTSVPVASSATPTPTSTPEATTTPISTPEATPTAIPTPTATQEPLVTPTTSAPATPALTPMPTPLATPGITPANGGNNLTVDYVISQSYNKVIINIENYKGYNVWRLTGPDRIVIDIPDAYVEEKQKTIDINKGFIDTVRYAQYEEGAARVVIDVSGQPQYHVGELNGRIAVYLMEPTYKNIEYRNNMDRIHFILQGAKLTEGGEFLKKLYKERYDLEGRKYTITFPSELADIGAGTMQINDGVLDYIEIKPNDETNETSIEFNTKDSYNYEIITRSEVNNTTVTLIKRASKADKLVVIDAGHGGKDPGAVHGGFYEKDFNLDIAKRLNALLKSKNVKTYMMREDDSYVGLYERAYIANSLNATLFLSIHNNAYYSRFKGTETLYYPPSAGDAGFNGKRFSQIIQDNLIKKLNMVDRGIVERPKLVVLKATKMHASLAEIAFMTNSEDMAKLKTESFRQKTAEALCDSILQALQEVN